VLREKNVYLIHFSSQLLSNNSERSDMRGIAT